MTYRQVSPNISFPKKCPLKIKVNRAKSWFVGGNGLQKRGQILIRLSKFENSYARWCCENSSVFIITQSNNRNRDYSVIWLIKISLEQLLFELGSFSERLVYQETSTFWKELYCLFHKSLLPSVTFVNSIVLNEKFLHHLCLCSDIVFAQLEVIARKRNNFAEIATVAECYLITTHV